MFETGLYSDQLLTPQLGHILDRNIKQNLHLREAGRQKVLMDIFPNNDTSSLGDLHPRLWFKKHCKRHSALAGASQTPNGSCSRDFVAGSLKQKKYSVIACCLKNGMTSKKDLEAEKREARYMEVSKQQWIHKFEKLQKELNEALPALDYLKKQSATQSLLSTRSSKGENSDKSFCAKLLWDCRITSKRDYFFQNVNFKRL